MINKITSLLKFTIDNPLVRRFSSFSYLNITQFLGALNDNIYKFLIVYFLIDMEGIERSQIILATTGAVFVLPFILFSSTSGILADRVSKRNIIIFTKILEFVVMVGGITSFYFHSIIGSYVVLFLMATHSSIFSPSKYGILPELVAEEKISKANGLMTSMTFLAIIFGTFTASFVLQVTHRDFLVAASLCSFVALIGIVTSFCIEYTPPSGSSKQFDARFLKDIFNSLKIASREQSLLMAVLGSSFFLFLGSFTQLNMIPFAVQSLGLTDVEGGYLFLLTSLGIGTGSVIAGKISGKTVELGLVPFAGIGICISALLLDYYSDTFYPVVALVIILGMFGGMWQIPLDSYVQVTSPNQYRGQIIAATNFLSFIGVLCASGLVYLIKEVFGLNADKGFTIIGVLAGCVTLFFSYKFFDYMTRFVASLLARLHFSISFRGTHLIPEEPAIYLCHHQAWNDTLLLLGSQRRRMRFFIEEEQSHSPMMRKLYGLLKVVSITSIEPLEHNPDCLEQIKKSLKRGISVCIFLNHANLDNEMARLRHSDAFREILKGTDYFIIPVTIDKGENHHKSRLLTSLLRKFRVPAEVTFGSFNEVMIPPSLYSRESYTVSVNYTVNPSES